MAKWEHESRVRMAGALNASVVASGRSKASIARQLDMDAKQLSRYLSAENAPPLGFLAPFAEATGESVEAILKRAGLIPEKSDFEHFIDSDTELTPEWRELVKASYRTARQSSAARA